MALRHTGKCMGGPWHGQERAYFSDEMDVTHLDGNPLTEIAFKVVGTYKHDGKALWTWFGPGVKREGSSVTFRDIGPVDT